MADTELKKHKTTKETTNAKQPTDAAAAQLVLDAWVLATGRDPRRARPRAWRWALILLVHGIFPEIYKTTVSDEICKGKVK